jgi:hypothetical protein
MEVVGEHMSTTHDWYNRRKLLFAGSIPAFNAFFKVHPISEVRAIGYTWEWGQPDAAFYCVANTQTGLEKGIIECNRYRTEKLNDAEARQEVRWEAGWFPYPAGLTGPVDELGAAWESEADTFHAITEAMRPADPSNEAQYAEYSRSYRAFLASLETTCCEALAEIAGTGLFDGATDLDFWVGSTDENGDVVRERDARIRKLIK